MKKGISLVALVVTIIVLIILTAAVIMTGADTPGKTNEAVFRSDLSTIQEAVTIKVADNMIEIETAKEGEVAGTDYPAHKLADIVVLDSDNKPVAATDKLTITGVSGDVTVYPIADTAAAELKISGKITITDFAVDDNGKVYYIKGIKLDPEKEDVYVTADLVATAGYTGPIEVSQY